MTGPHRAGGGGRLLDQLLRPGRDGRAASHREAAEKAAQEAASQRIHGSVKNVFGKKEQTQQAIIESISGTITRIDEDKIYDLTEEEVKIIADIIENGTWNTEGTAECANDCKLIIDERTYYYHSECGTFNDKENNQNLPVTAEEKESINAILAQYITLGLE